CQPLADGGMVEKVCGGRNGRSRRRPSLPHQPFAGTTHANDAGAKFTKSDSTQSNDARICYTTNYLL
ncbi:MAG: hypothetical protein WBO48_09485, partial [Candidatus Promineifilaceae bacterium]